MTPLISTTTRAARKGCSNTTTMMQRFGSWIKGVFAWWFADIRRRPSLLGKATSLGLGFLVLCCGLSSIVAAFQNVGERAGIVPTRTARPLNTTVPTATTAALAIVSNATAVPAVTPTATPTVLAATAAAEPTVASVEPTLIPPPGAPSPTPESAPTAEPAATPEPTPDPTATAEPQPTVAPEPTSPPALPAPSYNGCQADPSAEAAPNYPVRIARIDKSGEVVYLKNVSPDPVSLDGWKMCSIKGNQQVAVGGSLAPGETREFPSADGTIWNNSDRDDGALYNDQNQLVSYLFDR